MKTSSSMCVSMCVPLCVTVCVPSVYQCVSRVCTSVCTSVYQVCTSVYQVCTSVYQVCTSVCTSVYQCVYHCVYHCVYQCVYQSVSQSVKDFNSHQRNQLSVVCIITNLGYTKSITYIIGILDTQSSLSRDTPATPHTHREAGYVHELHPKHMLATLTVPHTFTHVILLQLI